MWLDACCSFCVGCLALSFLCTSGEENVILIIIDCFLSRTIFFHNQEVGTTYLVSRTLRARKSGSGLTTWDIEKTRKLILANHFDATSGNSKKTQQPRANNRQYKWDQGLQFVVAWFLEIQVLQHTPMPSQKEPMNESSGNTGMSHQDGKRGHSCSSGREGGIWLDGVQWGKKGRYKRERDISTIEWRLPKKGKVSGWESIAHIILLWSGEEN